MNKKEEFEKKNTEHVKSGQEKRLELEGRVELELLLLVLHGTGGVGIGLAIILLIRLANFL